MASNVISARTRADELPWRSARATIRLDVRSTHVRIKSLPLRDLGNGPIKSMIQCVNDWTGTLEKLSTPNSKPLALLAVAHVQVGSTAAYKMTHVTKKIRPPEELCNISSRTRHPRMPYHGLSVGCMKDSIPRRFGHRALALHHHLVGNTRNPPRCARRL